MSESLSDQDRASLEGIIDEYTSGNRRIAGLVYGALVEKGIISLDDADQLEAVAPELRHVKVLDGTSTDNFQLVEKRRRITLRMLLTHTAGFGYAFEDESLAQYSRPVGLDDFSGDRDDVIRRPLVNQPGEIFQYGTSMDWVGIIIERITELSLEEYFQAYIFQPVNMDVSFYLSDEAKKNLAYLHERLPGGSLKHTDHIYRRPLTWKQTVQGKNMFCAGGHGIFGKPAEFLKLIALLLNDGTDSKTGAQLLRPDTVREMFKDQIPDKPRHSDERVPVAKPWLANPTPLSPMPEDHMEGWGLSFSINHFPEKSGRASGSASWEGLANLYWFADRTNNVGAIIATQILPYGERFQELVAVLDSFPREIFDSFEVHRTYYKSSGVQIGADILIPRSGPRPKVRPVIVRIHGGFLITGASLYPAWFSKWVLQYATAHGAVIISPDYRLLPEVKGRDILDDFKEFWAWFESGSPQQHLLSAGRSDIIIDPERHLLIGESAGGYLAIQSVLSQFTRPRAIIALYPMLDLKSEYYNTSYEKPICGVPNFPNEAVSDFLESISERPVITEANPPLRLDLALAVVQNGRLLEILGEDPDLFPLERIAAPEFLSGGHGKPLLPPSCIFHGREDSAVPVEGTLKFVEILKRVNPTTRVKLVIRPGDHGFDALSTPDDPWLNDALSYTTREWLGEAHSKI
ncbi:hypothetical protein G7Z17_g4791 [Cylindrodendrum hubeiense]|uniref:Uncharacterized protein n=1 Tax=Cylindrodendrum hubeiense TaxID=595255 RepID=A0A9P5HDB3_9HYPO|nr:hypothetical protein G7Z17_g4791 [Cylindrodendrum hubeiense]